MLIKFDLNNFKLNYKQPHPKQFTNEIGLFVADFEVSRKQADQDDVFVYSTAYMDVKEEKDVLYHNYNVKDFMENLINQPHQQIICAFHNLSYDIVPIITDFISPKFKQIRNEYTKSDKNNVIRMIKGGKQKIIDNIIDEDQPKNIQPYTYDVIFANGQFYCLDLYLDPVTVKVNGRNKKKLKQIRFIDTFKIINRDLKTVADEFLDLEISKADLDHNIIRTENYNPTDAEKRYIYEDVKVLKDLLYITKIQGVKISDNFHVTFNKMTTASQSLHEYKKMIFNFYQTENLRNDSIALQVGKNELDRQKKYFEEKGKKFRADHDEFFKCIFPKIDLNCDRLCRTSYFGGITWVNHDLINKHKQDNNPLNGLIFDVNSMYPFIQRNCLLPYGRPQLFANSYEDQRESFKEEYPLYIQRVKIRQFKLKPNKMPMIQVKNSNFFPSTEYLKDNTVFDSTFNEYVHKPVVFALTNIQLKLLLDSYELPLGIQYLDGYAFKGSYNMFTDFIDTLMDGKKSDNKTIKALSKLLMNANYGKYGTNPRREERIMTVNDGIFSTTNRDENDNQLYYIGEQIYLPVATFITSYARELLCNTVNAIGVNDRVLYVDTDSCHILNYDIPTNINIHPKELGAWKLEGLFTDARYLGAKRYAEKILYTDETYKKILSPSDYDPKQSYPSKWDIKCCGVSSDTIRKIDDISTFTIAEMTQKNFKELQKNKKIYTKDGTIYYYHDKNCTQPIKGIYRSKKKKYVRGGVLIHEQAYHITSKVSIISR